VIIFETNRLIVRRYELADADNFFLLNGDEEVTRYIRPAKSRVESDAFLKYNIAFADEQPLYGRWAVIEKGSGVFVGSFALIPVEESLNMQLGYALLPAAWGKGYATELTLAGLDYIFHKTDLETIYAYTEMPNTPSQKVLLKTGFKRKREQNQGEKTLVEFAMTKKEYLLNVSMTSN